MGLRFTAELRDFALPATICLMMFLDPSIPILNKNVAG